MAQHAVVIRADGSAAIGMGHLMRCSVLADELIVRGWSCVFLSREYDKQGLAYFRRKGHSFEVMPADISLEDDLVRTLNIVRTIKARLLVTDSYQFDATYLKGIAATDALTLNIDDCGCVRQFSCLVLNQNAPAVMVKYDSEKKTNFLLGPKYALIRKDLREAKEKLRPIVDFAIHVLVTMGGGADQDNVTGRIVEALNQLPNISCDIVISQGHVHLKTLKGVCHKSKGKFVLHVASDRMGELMVNADLMLSAGGTTSWERCYLGVPGFMVALAEDQEPNVKYLHERGAVISLGLVKSLTVEMIRRSIEALIPDVTLRCRMRECGQELVDGQGVFRVVDEIEKKIE